ncbi:hypothetical protein LTR53_017040 [Teratosphaeriaceae sp. CCFEE 6253]|nr:hypothetical protein LTR53_017040 [Teratosphaeriaceae sp. CCFEE 6253]
MRQVMPYLLQPDCEQHARRDLRQHIQPTADRRPLTPNCTIEAKRPRGFSDVVRTQATHNGAHGARAVRGLHNYSDTNTGFDRQAGTLSYTYIDGHLRYYSTHAVPPTGGRTADYHTHLLGGIDMAASVEQYVDGVRAVRNDRDFCGQIRRDLINAANGQQPCASASLSGLQRSYSTPVSPSASQEPRSSRPSAAIASYTSTTGHASQATAISAQATATFTPMSQYSGYAQSPAADGGASQRTPAASSFATPASQAS